MAGPKQVKHSIALAVTEVGQPDRVILVCRPLHDEDFPGMWGLPAASCKNRENLHMAAARVGIQKLGVALEVGPVLATGTQQRPGYNLEMTLFEAQLTGSRPALPQVDESGEGPTLYTDWRWGEAEDLGDSAEKGSLCSQLLLENRGLRTNPG
mgnify:FL=1